jgi:hypothetical protein
MPHRMPQKDSSLTSSPGATLVCRVVPLQAY